MVCASDQCVLLWQCCAVCCVCDYLLWAAHPWEEGDRLSGALLFQLIQELGITENADAAGGWEWFEFGGPRHLLHLLKAWITTHHKKMAKHSATFIPIICSLFYLGQWTSRSQPPGAWWKTRSGHRWFILYFYVPDNAFSVVWIAASSGFEMTLHLTCNNCTISTLSDRRDFFPNRTKKNILNSCALRLRWRRHIFPFLGHL